MFTRFNGNVEPFASDATGMNRTVFGDTVQSDNIDDNLNVDFLRGWEIVGVNDNPTKQDFNALAFTISNLVAYLYQQGVAEWNATQKYLANSYVVGSDGKLYRAKTGTTGTPNEGNDPTTDSTNWSSIYASNQTLSVSSPITIIGNTIFLNLGDGSQTSVNIPLASVSDSGLVSSTSQTFGGIKTFSSFPITPSSAPTADYQVANKKYVDNNYIELINSLGTSAYADVTTSSTDTTAGRVMKVGDGGWMGREAGHRGPLGYPTSIDDVTNLTRTIRSDVDNNGVPAYTAGIHLSTSDTWGRLRVRYNYPGAWIQGGLASNGTGWTSQVVLSDNLLQTTGSSTKFPMSQKAATDAINAGAETPWVANDTRAKTALNASGTAPIYACRAWVNFNGTGTVAIRASGNVSSITDLGTGRYRVNFTTAMPNTNYAIVLGFVGQSNTDPSRHAVIAGTLTGGASNKTTSYCEINSGYSSDNAMRDMAEINVVIFG